MVLPFANVQRMNLPRLRREMTVMALAGLAASGLFALHFGFHPAMSGPAEAGWTGQLAAPAPEPQMESLSSASLVVPKDQLALPPEPVKPKPRVKMVCDSAGADCAARAPLPVAPAAAAAPSVRKVAVLEDKMTARDPALKVPPRPPGLIPNPVPAGKAASGHAGQNPGQDQHSSLFAIAARPFVSAGNTVARWIKSL